MSIQRRVAILGSTGSIGVNTLDVIRSHPERYQVVALTANQQVDRLLAQCREFKPRIAVIGDAQSAKQLTAAVLQEKIPTTVLYGAEALVSAVNDSACDTVMAAIVGAAGLLPTLAAARAGKRVLLANKEALVMSGDLLMQAVRDSGAELIPIDSEHNAIFQCLPAGFNALHTDAARAECGVEELWLTASGGPFRTTPLVDLANITPDQACAHPNWVMGRKISVDSATMMNKGLEVIEAQWLFGVPLDNIRVLIHPQSVVHSMVRYRDGSVIAQLGQPDMRTPIAYGLAWPQRIAAGVMPLDLTQLAALNFAVPDFKQFPCLSLAFAAARIGGTAPAILNAANEIAVGAFLASEMSYLQIASLVEQVLEQVSATQAQTLDEVLDADQTARRVARQSLTRMRTH